MAPNFSLPKSLTFASVFFAGAAFSLPITQLLPTIAQPQQSVAQSSPQAISPNFIAAAVEKTGPAVVRIDSGGTRLGRNSNRNQRGVGSGFIIDSNGTLLTNAHVVDGSSTVRVTLSDGRSFNGQVLGRDKLTDLAAIKISGNNLPTVKLGNSDNLKPGEWAIAIGNPLGLDNSVTAGIISGTGRSSGLVGTPDKRLRFIQTDAAINPGNSGGPLLNQRGEVIGINTAIIGRAQGLGFAIPINRARSIAERLVAGKQVEHPYLGISMATLTPGVVEDLTQQVNLRVTANQGVLILNVANNSPAARAGLRAGDVIQQIDGRKVITADELQQQVEKTSVGGNVGLEVNRNGRNVNINIRPGQFPVS